MVGYERWETDGECIFHSLGTLADLYRLGDGELIVALHNAAVSVNPTNPLAVAEAEEA